MLSHVHMLPNDVFVLVVQICEGGSLVATDTIEVLDGSTIGLSSCKSEDFLLERLKVGPVKNDLLVVIVNLEMINLTIFLELFQLVHVNVNTSRVTDTCNSHTS
jgi:hypothetical protein